MRPCHRGAIRLHSRTGTDSVRTSCVTCGFTITSSLVAAIYEIGIRRQDFTSPGGYIPVPGGVISTGDPDVVAPAAWKACRCPRRKTSSGLVSRCRVLTMAARMRARPCVSSRPSTWEIHRGSIPEPNHVRPVVSTRGTGVGRAAWSAALSGPGVIAWRGNILKSKLYTTL